MASATLRRRLAHVESPLPGPTCDALWLYFGRDATYEHHGTAWARARGEPVVRAISLREAVTADCAPRNGHADEASWRASIAALVPRRWAPLVLNAQHLVLDGCITWGVMAGGGPSRERTIVPTPTTDGLRCVPSHPARAGS